MKMFKIPKGTSMVVFSEDGREVFKAGDKSDSRPSICVHIESYPIKEFLPFLLALPELMADKNFQENKDTIIANEFGDVTRSIDTFKRQTYKQPRTALQSLFFSVINSIASREFLNGKTMLLVHFDKRLECVLFRKYTLDTSSIVLKFGIPETLFVAAKKSSIDIESEEFDKFFNVDFFDERAVIHSFSTAYHKLMDDENIHSKNNIADSLMIRRDFVEIDETMNPQLNDIIRSYIYNYSKEAIDFARKALSLSLGALIQTNNPNTTKIPYSQSPALEISKEENNLLSKHACGNNAQIKAFFELKNDPSFGIEGLKILDKILEPNTERPFKMLDIVCIANDYEASHMEVVNALAKSSLLGNSFMRFVTTCSQYHKISVKNNMKITKEALTNIFEEFDNLFIQIEQSNLEEKAMLYSENFATNEAPLRILEVLYTGKISIEDFLRFWDNSDAGYFCKLPDIVRYHNAITSDNLDWSKIDCIDQKVIETFKLKANITFTRVATTEEIDEIYKISETSPIEAMLRMLTLEKKPTYK